MKHKLLSIIAAFLVLAIWWLTWTPYPHVPRTAEHVRQESPRYHGADLLKIGWKGEITAYRWEKGKYILMWKRL